MLCCKWSRFSFFISSTFSGSVMVSCLTAVTIVQLSGPLPSSSGLLRILWEGCGFVEERKLRVDLWQLLGFVFIQCKLRVGLFRGLPCHQSASQEVFVRMLFNFFLVKVDVFGVSRVPGNCQKWCIFITSV